MTEPVVLDASALFALALDEPGAETVASHLPRAKVSTVTLSEVYAKTLSQADLDVRAFGGQLSTVGVTFESFSQRDADLSLLVRQLDDARLAALPDDLPDEQRYKRKRASLGDRCCLALALRLGAPAMTSDTTWFDLGDPLRIISFRPSP